MFKRVFDIGVSFSGLLLASPILLCVMLVVWLQDFKSPLYIAPRVARDGGIFRMIKLRSMVANADKTGVDSTGANDMRITAVGHLIRRYKLDELTQLWNVLIGDMSIVGPRPNVKRETDLYTEVEKELLTVRPGITDFSSIVFADEGDVLAPYPDPDIAYNQLIRPWKSRLGIFYIRHASVGLDFFLCWLTVLCIFSRDKALIAVAARLASLDADEDLVQISRRDKKLQPTAPPGATEVVTAR